MSGAPEHSKTVSYYKQDGGNLIEKVTDDEAEARRQGFKTLEELFAPPKPDKVKK